MQKNNSFVCTKCGGHIEQFIDRYFCSKCGKEYSKDSLELEKDAVEQALLKTENTQPDVVPRKRNRTIHFVIIMCIIAVCSFLALKIFNSNTITSVLERHNYSSDKYSIVSSFGTDESPLTIDGMDANTKLVLLKYNKSGNKKYLIMQVNTKDKQVKKISFDKYKPLKVILSYITNTTSNESKNIDNYNRIVKYIEKYGIKCFNNKEKSKLYYNELTGENGLITVPEAQKLLTNSIDQLISKDKNTLATEIIFHDESAQPKYYCKQAIEEVYSFVVPEETYETWYESVDKETRDLTFAIYGSPYKEKKLWSLYNENDEKIGSFENKDTMYKYIESQKLQAQSKEQNKNAKSAKSLIVAIDGTNSLGAEIALIKTIASNLNYTIILNTTSKNEAILAAFKNNTCDVSFHQVRKKDYIALGWEDECSFSTEYYGDYVMLVDKDNATLLNEINRMITELKKNGTVATIFEGYGHTKGYYVRKTFSDKTPPVNEATGEFVHLNSAKKYADQYKSEGYKVFDSYGNCVYEPELSNNETSQQIEG